MILSEKLLALRTKAGLSQEDLAEKLDVSRQSVSKWESGSSIPEIDKILKISEIYGVSTDYLLKDEVEELPAEVVVDEFQPDSIREISLEVATEYLSLVKSSAARIALGVALCILSPVPLLVADGLVADGSDVGNAVGLGALFVIIAIAVIIFITNGLRMEEFEYLEKEEFRLSYGVAGIVEKELKEYRPIFYRGIALGVALCVISVVPFVVVSAIIEGFEGWACALMLALVALGVYLIVRVANRKDGYDTLLQQGDYTVEKKQEENRLEVFTKAYWLIVATIYLAVSFTGVLNWGISWIIFPIAGALFAALRTILSAVKK
ncbi:MAG: helix-turn-helix domain-containing protein [Oscillospiraceae bacterium]|nr:helix-turn-helix domain-containing protein [Oscillospiraceae bacterium]